jgi:Threonyl-tRNA synthetase
MDPIGDEELRVIEKKMNEHVRANHKIVREEFDNAGLREVIADNKFKLEIMDEKIGEEVGSSAYRQGDFIDMCRGPHAPSTSHLRFFKLTSTSQAYWRADSKREPLTRIYGMCYATKEGLKARQQQIQEAGKRDHKKIGKEMELYMIDELIGKGLPVWLPKRRDSQI